MKRDNTVLCREKAFGRQICVACADDTKTDENMMIGTAPRHQYSSEDLINIQGEEPTLHKKINLVKSRAISLKNY